ncbi:MAG: hypothetical protein ACJAUW_001795, partial [Yoonia sp.]
AGLRKAGARLSTQRKSRMKLGRVSAPFLYGVSSRPVPSTKNRAHASDPPITFARHPFDCHEALTKNAQERRLLPKTEHNFWEKGSLGQS